MDAETSKRTVRDFLELIQTGQTEAALALTTGNPDFIIFNNPFPGGAQAFGGLAKSLFTDGPHREFTAQFVDGGTVISQVIIRGTTTKGEQYENYYLIICTLKDGKVDRVQEYMDTAYANKKFGFG